MSWGQDDDHRLISYLLGLPSRGDTLPKRKDQLTSLECCEANKLGEEGETSGLGSKEEPSLPVVAEKDASKRSHVSCPLVTRSSCPCTEGGGECCGQSEQPLQQRALHEGERCVFQADLGAAGLQGRTSHGKRRLFTCNW